ncbi:MAG: OmpH family outer membrane protein [Thiomargarita sp.]|nr:OmpH family outer membrane protein [Thiomargarita sp.]
MKIRHFYLIITLLCSLYSTQVAAELKIGFVNAIRVMEKAPQVKHANRRLEREFAPKQRRLASAKQGIRKKEERFAKNSAIMSDAEVRKSSREIRDTKRDFKRQQEEFREDYNTRRTEELEKIQKVITKVIQDLAKRESYDFILSDGVIWASKRVDLTNKVLNKLRNK